MPNGPFEHGAAVAYRHTDRFDGAARAAVAEDAPPSPGACSPWSTESTFRREGVGHHSATLPSSWRQTGLCQSMSSSDCSRTCDSSTSMPSPGSSGIPT